MPVKDPRVDAYIARSKPFARPILRRLRAVIHAGCPQVQETLKWGFPHFVHHGILCSMASFKAHCAFGFWKEKLLRKTHPELRTPAAHEAMGQFGRITRLADLPDDATLRGYVRAAAALNASGVKSPARRRVPRPPLAVPADLRAALRGNPKAAATFAGFSPTHRRDYVEWISEAKRDATRARRLTTAVRWMAEGKPRNWKYAR